MNRIRKSWKDIREGKPGRRFRDHYETMHRGGPHPVRRVLVLVLGVAVTAAGVFLLPAPGPGTLVLVFGVGLIGQESVHAARLLDWLELRLRKLYKWARAVWKRLPLPAKVYGRSARCICTLRARTSCSRRSSASRRLRP